MAWFWERERARERKRDEEREGESIGARKKSVPIPALPMTGVNQMTLKMWLTISEVGYLLHGYLQ